MFKENRFIKFEIVPESRNHPKRRPQNFEKSAQIVEKIKEKEKTHQEEDAKVAENLIDDIETIGIACPRCGLKNTMLDKKLNQTDHLHNHFYCKECHYRWTEKK